MSNDLASRSLAYHANPQPGKLKILPSKPCTTQDDLSLAYTPGVAVPCTEIHDHPEKIWQSNLFGRSFQELVGEDLSGKLRHLPEDARQKLRLTLERILNEGSGGLICIIL